MRWVPLAQPQAYSQPPPYTLPPPSPGLRPFLIVVLVVADVVTGLFAIFGLPALADYLGLAGTDHTPGDAASYTLIAIFVVLFAVMLAATIGVVRRSGWARIVTFIAGGALTLTCLGSVLGIPIIVAAIRAPMKRPQPAR